MLDYNKFACYTWAGFGIRTGDWFFSLCSQECWSTMHSTATLSRLWYLPRWFNCYLRSQECSNTMHSTARPEQEQIFASWLHCSESRRGGWPYDLWWPTNLIINILPEIQGDKLETRDHGPAEVVKTCVAKVWIVTNILQTCVVCWTSTAQNMKQMKLHVLWSRFNNVKNTLK